MSTCTCRYVHGAFVPAGTIIHNWNKQAITLTDSHGHSGNTPILFRYGTSEWKGEVTSIAWWKRRKNDVLYLDDEMRGYGCQHFKSA